VMDKLGAKQCAKRRAVPQHPLPTADSVYGKISWRHSASYGLVKVSCWYADHEHGFTDWAMVGEARPTCR
jgi:hypothetical protein